MDTSNLGLGLAWYLVFVFSVIFHEAAHALVAMKLGDPTAYHGGQVTLNPVPHIKREPFGMVIVPLLSYFSGGWMFGWGSAPYDPQWASQYPRRSALMSLAGPTANLILVLAAAALIRAGMAAGMFSAPDRIIFSQVTTAGGPGLGHALAVVVSILFTLNLILLIFNLIPFPPLDGGGILPLIMTRDSSARLEAMIHHPMFSIIGLIVAWNLFDRLFRPVHLFAINLLYPGVGYH